jgi:peptide/nickel transport system permease protein
LYGFTLWAMLTINFLLPRAMPGDPLLALVDQESQSFVRDENVRQRLAQYYGLDQPVWRQYLAYIGHLAHGDLGWSISQRAPVLKLISIHLPWTLLLMIPSIALSTALSLIAGVNAGWVRGSVLDRGLVSLFVISSTIPAFLIGLFLLLVFSVRFGWLPLAGAYTPFRLYHGVLDQFSDVLSHLTLPMVSLTLTMLGRDFLLARSSMITVLGEEFMLVARGKGLSERALKYRHGLRNALLPVVTRFALQIGTAVTGVVLIESLFAYPGMGRLMFNAVTARDYPLIEGCFLIAGLAVLVANIVAEMSYAWLDPRTRRDA